MHNFIELKGGNFLIQGFLGEKSAQQDRGRSYFAEFDGAGRLVRTSTEKHRPDFDLSNWPGDSSALQGEDGSIYVLEPDRVAVLSPGGTMQRNIPLSPPEPGYRPYQMYMAGQRLEISYYKVSKQQSRPNMLYVVADTSTGKPLRVYKAAPELGNTLVCFSDQGFTFYRTENGHIKLVTSHPE